MDSAIPTVSYMKTVDRYLKLLLLLPVPGVKKLRGGRGGSIKNILFVDFTPQNVITIAAKCNTDAKCNNIDAKCNKVFNAKCNNFLIPTQNVMTFLTQNVTTQNVIQVFKRSQSTYLKVSHIKLHGGCI